MKRVAIGVRMHSGWGALVAVSGITDALEIIDRRRIALSPPGTPGANQPYHFAENLELPEAEKFLRNCFAISKRLAVEALRNVVHELGDREYRVIGCAALLGSGRPLPPLANILSSHALIHAAEGEFFRTILAKACDDLELRVTGVRERDLNERVQREFGKAANRILHQISTLGRSLGPPWTTDQKTSALAATLLLAQKPDRLRTFLRENRI